MNWSVRCGDRGDKECLVDNVGCDPTVSVDFSCVIEVLLLLSSIIVKLCYLLFAIL